MKRVLFLFCLISITVAKTFSQAKLENRNTFYMAENFVLYEEYKEALPLYQQLLKISPANANFKYRIGQCLINMPGRKAEAMSYLEDAVKNINLKYKEGKYKETKAPYDAYYYLANAYRINKQLNKALDTYMLFKKNLDPEVYDTSVVNLQIESCRNAQEVMKVPLFVKKVNLGEIINGRYSDFNPVVSADESVMVFNKGAAFQDFLYFSKKLKGKWTEPVDIIPDLGPGFDEKNYATSLSNDGRELYMYRPGADYDGNIYVTRRDNNDKWSVPVKLNDNINTKYWESHASISHDGKKLLFTSNRKGTFGGLDIYISERDSTGDWGPAKNIGQGINTKYNEDSPFLGKDDKTLYFSSSGHFNIGGYDIFYSSLMENGQWSVPLNVGFPLNTTDDDQFFNPVNDGYQGYYSLEDSGGQGLQDIYRIEIFSREHPRKFFVRGIVQVKDLQTMFGDSVKVSALNTEDPNASVVVYSNPKTGEYKFELPQGDYEITYEAEGAQKTINRLILPMANPADSFVLPGTTLPKTDFVADMEVSGNKTISVASGDELTFPLIVEPLSVLVVEHWLGDSLLYTEKFDINDTTFVYKTVPQPGDNRIVFQLTDKYNNTTTSDIFIKREKLVTEQPLARPEYNRIIARKQIVAFVGMLKLRADDKLKKVIQRSDIDKQTFGRVDDITSYLKEEAAKSSISPDDIDKLALRVAVMDNVLTQSAVDLMARNTQGELKNILGALDIYSAGLKTWTELQEYISEKSSGKIQPEELNKIAADVLADVDTSISPIRDKIFLYGDNSENGKIINQAVKITDAKSITNSGLWLQSVYNESLNLKMTDSEFADMILALTLTPGTDGEKYLEELIRFSDGALKDYLTGSQFAKSGAKTPKDILLHLLRNKDKGLFPEVSLFDALAKLIASKEISEEQLTSQIESTKGNCRWIFWIIIAAGLMLFILIINRRKKKRENK